MKLLIAGWAGAHGRHLKSENKKREEEKRGRKIKININGDMGLMSADIDNLAKKLDERLDLDGMAFTQPTKHGNVSLDRTKQRREVGDEMKIHKDGFKKVGKWAAIWLGICAACWAAKEIYGVWQ